MAVDMRQHSRFNLRDFDVPSHFLPDLESILIPEGLVISRIHGLSNEISEHYEGNEEIYALVILDGAVKFYSTLLINRRIPFPFRPILRKASSYIGTLSTGQVSTDLDGLPDIKGRKLLIIEDIVDTGHTLTKIIEGLRSYDPKDIKVCTMLDKPSRRETDLIPDFTGFTIPNEFVVGYGMDYNELFRTLPHIAVLNPSVYRTVY